MFCMWSLSSTHGLVISLSNVESMPLSHFPQLLLFLKSFHRCIPPNLLQWIWIHSKDMEPEAKNCNKLSGLYFRVSSNPTMDIKRSFFLTCRFSLPIMILNGCFVWKIPVYRPSSYFFGVYFENFVLRQKHWSFRPLQSFF